MESTKQVKLAVLIDADNTSASSITSIMTEIAKFGTANAKRVYGDWSSPHLKGWKENLTKFALVPVQQFAYTKGKDATDMQLIIDAMDLLYSNTYDGFCILSSDSDFTPLAMRIRESGLVAYGFGMKKTPEAFRQSCDRFFYIENLEDDVTKETEAVASKLPFDDSIKQLLFKSVKDSTDDNTGWAYVGHIGQYLNQTKPDFDVRNYDGFSNLSSMLKKLDILQFKHDETSRMFCRKIPYSDVAGHLRIAVDKFHNKDGWAKISAVEKYINPRWSYEEYGFNSFEELLQNIHYIELSENEESIKITSVK